MTSKKPAAAPKNQGKPKVVSKAKAAGKTDRTAGSLLKCEVQIESGEWLTPESCKVFYINEDAQLPQMEFEIKTNASGPFEWSWEITWVVMACPQARNKLRFKPKTAKTYSKKGEFSTGEKKWKAEFDGEVLGGDLTIKVKAGSLTFIRKCFIRAKEPGESKVHAELETYSKNDLVEVAKKIFKQETKTKHLYSDEMPLVSFDNGYGLGQLTNPQPTYEQAWNWKAHVKQVIEKVLPGYRKIAKFYLDTHAEYTNEMLNLETYAAYNGLAKKQRYHKWDEGNKKWEVNDNVLCDPAQSNKGWLMTEEENKGKSLPDLRKNKDSKPFYTGRCYAEHIKNSN
jgi:hypothetical protein